MNVKQYFDLSFSLAKNISSYKKLFLISEIANWAIYEDCRNIQRELRETLPTEISYLPIGLRKKIVHFASENTLLGRNSFREEWFWQTHPSNKIVLTWFHISDSDISRLHLIRELNDRVDIVHTASRNTERKLLENGLQKEKIVVVPLGVDTRLFFPVNKDQKESIRKRLGIPSNRFLIGSFQKDGNGWGEGLEPKLIKGPDIFCDVVERLAREFPIHILLTGPARGYVKQRLDNAGIPYTHHFLECYEDIADYYRALDLYIIASREEGGPKALLESLASGIPLVSTPVGMVPEIIKNGQNGFVSSEINAEELFGLSQYIIENNSLRKKLSSTGRKTIEKYSNKEIISQLYTDIYAKILTQ